MPGDRCWLGVRLCVAVPNLELQHPELCAFESPIVAPFSTFTSTLTTIRHHHLGIKFTPSVHRTPTTLTVAFRYPTPRCATFLAAPRLAPSAPRTRTSISSSRTRKPASLHTTWLVSLPTTTTSSSFCSSVTRVSESHVFSFDSLMTPTPSRTSPVSISTHHHMAFDLRRHLHLQYHQKLLADILRNMPSAILSTVLSLPSQPSVLTSRFAPLSSRARP